MGRKKINENTDVWYNLKASDQDVVVSTRIRLSRNLASFPFTSNFKNDDGDRVQNIVFDAFSKLNNPDSYQSMSLKNLDKNGSKILAERGLLGSSSATGLITTTDGVSACLINDDDHLKLSSFASGLELEAPFQRVKTLDDELQQFVQFAASRDFGYLSPSVYNTGSGMKCSLYVHLPSLSYSNEIVGFIKEIQEKGFGVSDVFGVGSLFNASLGAYYQIFTTSSLKGNEVEQLGNIFAVGKYICEFERKKRRDYADNKPTVVHNIVVRAYSLAKFSILLNLRDCIDIISCLKWGLDLGFITGIEDFELNSLLYRVQSGHLGYLLKTSTFSFEEDIVDNPELKEDRLRAIVLKSTVDKINFAS